MKENDVVNEDVIEVEVAEVKQPGVFKGFWTRHGGKVKKAGKGAAVVIAMALAYGLGKTSNDSSDDDYLGYDGDDDATTYDYDVDETIEDGSN